MVVPVVSLWLTPLEPAPALAASYGGCLSGEERARAAAFTFARHRDRFVVGRAFLRHVLGAHVDVAPADVALRADAGGKPALCGEARGIRFNLAHSEEIAVCAVATNLGEVGVDVERVRPMADMDAVALAAFSAAENARLRTIPDAARPRAFFEAWTRKEAFLKALGCGLSRPLATFDVAFGPGESARLLASRTDSSEPARVALLAFEPAPGYVGAVAIVGPRPVLRVRTWRWP